MLLHYSPLLKNTCVRQVVSDKWFPLTLARTRQSRGRGEVLALGARPARPRQVQRRPGDSIYMYLYTYIPIYLCIYIYIYINVYIYIYIERERERYCCYCLLCVCLLFVCVCVYFVCLRRPGDRLNHRGSRRRRVDTNLECLSLEGYLSCPPGVIHAITTRTWRLWGT